MKNSSSPTPRSMCLLPGRHVRVVSFALALAATLVSLDVHADGRSAATSVHANIMASRTNIGFETGNLIPGPTMIRGMYSLTSPAGEVMGFTNESGTLFGSYKSFYVISPSGAPLRKMRPNEQSELVHEIMNSIDYDKLVRITSGNGGGRRLVLFSAIDCPACTGFEAILAKAMRETETTVYVAPSALQLIEQGGQASWEKVARLWCAENNGRAWQTYWQSRAVPAARPCSITAQSAQAMSKGLSSILSGAGVDMKGVPALLREDGTTFDNPQQYSAGYAFVLGRQGNSSPVQRPGKWLVAGMRPVDEPHSGANQPQTGQYQQPGQAQQPNTIKASDLLKKLFK